VALKRRTAVVGPNAPALLVYANAVTARHQPGSRPRESRPACRRIAIGIADTQTRTTNRSGYARRLWYRLCRLFARPWQSRFRDGLPPQTQWSKLDGCGHVLTFDNPDGVVRVILGTTAVDAW